MLGQKLIQTLKIVVPVMLHFYVHDILRVPNEYTKMLTCGFEVPVKLLGGSDDQLSLCQAGGVRGGGAGGERGAAGRGREGE